MLPAEFGMNCKLQLIFLIFNNILIKKVSFDFKFVGFIIFKCK